MYNTIIPLVRVVVLETEIGSDRGDTTDRLCMSDQVSEFHLDRSTPQIVLNSNRNEIEDSLDCIHEEPESSIPQWL